MAGRVTEKGTKLFGGKMNIEWEKDLVYFSYIDVHGKLQVNVFRTTEARQVAEALLQASDRADTKKEERVHKKRKLPEKT